MMTPGQGGNLLIYKSSLYDEEICFGPQSIPFLKKKKQKNNIFTGAREIA